MTDLTGRLDRPDRLPDARAEVVDAVREALARQGAELTPARVAAALRDQGRPVGDAAVLAVHDRLTAEVLGAGPLEPLLRTPGVTDVLVNGPDAVYLDRGGEVATEFVLRLITPLMRDPDRFGAAMDPKTSLQEIAARRGATAPVYVVTESGPDHNKHFVATVTVGDLVSASGEGSSKKQAEMAAALEAWTRLSDRDR